MGLIAALLTSLTIAREWERGTMEQLISTPVKAPELILGKLVPYFVIGMLDMLIAVLMAVFLFDVPLLGSVPLLFAMAALFIIGTLSQGILISTLARQQLLASQVAMVSTFLPAFLLSGFMFAIPTCRRSCRPSPTSSRRAISWRWSRASTCAAWASRPSGATRCSCSCSRRGRPAAAIAKFKKRLA